MLTFVAAILLAAPIPVESQPEVAARRLALAAVRGPRAEFEAAVDADALVEKKVGPEAWRALTERQRNLLRAVTRDRFAAMLAPPSPDAGAGIAWSQELPRAGGLAEVVLGIAIGEKTLKTKWRLKPEASAWRIEDVVLTDPGISLASAAVSSLGPEAVRRQPWWPRAMRQVVPWLALLAILGIVLRLTAPRISADRRPILYRAAAIPAAIVIVGAIVAAVRVATQPYVVHVEGAGTPSPSAYDRGLAAKAAGDTEAARRAFEESLSSPAPAAGASRELASMDLEAGHLPGAEKRIASYLAAAGPDPDALVLQAVIEANLGNQKEAVEAVAGARRLLGPGPKAAELEARIRARASDAAGAVAALRPLVEEKALTRETLRADPAYLAIAADPAWVRFLNEKEAR